MPTYHTNEIVFELSEQLKDRSVNIFSTNYDGPSEFSLVITRDYLELNETLEDLLARQIRLMSEKLSKFELLERKNLKVDRTAAIQTDYRWTLNGKVLRQRQIALLPPPPTSGRVLVLLLAATAEGEIPPAWDAKFRSIIGSVRIHLPPSSV